MQSQFFKIQIITETHSDQTLEECNKYSQCQISMTGDIEHQQHAHENQCCLANHYEELAD